MLNSLRLQYGSGLGTSFAFLAFGEKKKRKKDGSTRENNLKFLVFIIKMETNREYKNREFLIKRRSK